MTDKPEIVSAAELAQLREYCIHMTDGSTHPSYTKGDCELCNLSEHYGQVLVPRLIHTVRELIKAGQALRDWEGDHLTDCENGPHCILCKYQRQWDALITAHEGRRDGK